MATDFGVNVTVQSLQLLLSDFTLEGLVWSLVYYFEKLTFFFFPWKGYIFHSFMVFIVCHEL